MELLREELHAAFDRQAETIKAWDSKSQILLGFVLAAIGLTAKAEMPSPARFAAMLVLVLAFVFGAVALRPRDYRDPFADPERLVAAAVAGSGPLLDSIARSYKSAILHNIDALKDREQAWTIAAVLFAVGAALTVIGVGWRIDW